MSTLQVELVAADRKVWEGEADMVVARTVDGELGILPGHTPLLGVLVEGEVRIKAGEGTQTATSTAGSCPSTATRSSSSPRPSTPRRLEPA